MNINELEMLKSDCRMKASNLQMALETLNRSDYQELWPLQNYLSCIEESAITIKKLTYFLQKDQIR